MVVTQSVSPMEPTQNVLAEKALMEILSSGVLISTNAQIKYAEQMRSVSTLLVGMTADVNWSIKETHSWVVSPRNHLWPTFAPTSNAAPTLFVLWVSASA